MFVPYRPSAMSAIKNFKTRQQFFKYCRKRLAFIAPFWKNKDDYPSHLKDYLHLQLQEGWLSRLIEAICALITAVISLEIGTSPRSLRIKYTMAEHIEKPFAGVSVICIGAFCSYARYIKYLDAEHHVTIKIGESTTTGCALEGTTGCVVKNGSYDHVTLELLEGALRKLEFTSQMQEMPLALVFTGYKPVIIQYDDWDDDREIFFQRHREFVNNLTNMNYPRFMMSTNFKTVRVIDFSPPFMTLKIESDARFLIRAFPQLLSKLVNVPCHVVDASRTRIGPFVKEDCIQSYELYVNDIEKAHQKHHKKILDHFTPHLNKEITKPNMYRYMLD